MTDNMPAPVRILVVEDDETFRETVKEILRDLGYKVRGARGLNKATKRLTRHKFDLILSDVNIGNHSGFDVLEVAAQTRPNARIVMMSANADPEIVEQAKQSGAAHFLPKPFRVADLMAAVQRALVEADDQGSDENTTTVEID